MFDRIVFAATVLLTAGSCASGARTETADAQGAEALTPELAALVAQPQTGSFNPDTSKDAEFFRNTPERFRPFIAVCNPWDEWDKPAPPFKVHGNTYYVGTCGIAAILIAGEDGHVLIDGGTEAGGPLIADSIETLGFAVEDVEYILHSHEHFDHVAGVAVLQRLSGARLITSPIAKPVMESGVVDARDPQAGMHDAFPAAQVFQTIADGASVQLGDIEATAIYTPGHSPGALSWQWRSCEGEQCYSIVYADSLSPVSGDDYKFSEHPDYLAAYHAGLERLGYLDCDILLTPHPSHSRMLKRMRNDAMIEPTACAYYAIGKNQDIERRLESEAGSNE
ncbi:subclass B3 metallo-beta-lactamase [uncultured Erythrobacter sp.]|uniref:subclass B3 metallo-beta-lactamase n=1 Tax=uncultured Erythrobacter sp. TaxID=263913 RepID=UPI00260986BE|nr:subclass B3 metallo-beta-lactamase [uncultured Erythrobacter sp.]